MGKSTPSEKKDISQEQKTAQLLASCPSALS